MRMIIIIQNYKFILGTYLVIVDIIIINFYINIYIYTYLINKQYAQFH